MKIVMLAHRFPPYTGGTPKRVFRISRGLSLRGHEVTVYTSIHPKAPRVQEVGSLRVVGCDPLHPSISRFIKLPYYAMPGMLRRLLGEDEAQDADVIQTFHFLSFVSFVGACLKLLRRKAFSLAPIIMHHRRFMDGLRTAYGRRGIKAFLNESCTMSYFLTAGIRIIRAADLLTPQITQERDVLISYGVEPKRVRVIPGAIDVDLYARLPNPLQFRAKHSIRPDERLVLFVGQPTQWKGLHHLILAMGRVMRRIPRVRLVLVGPAAEKARRLLGLFGSPLVRSRTLITGPLYGRQLVSAYASSDVFVLPSVGERFGTVIVEALASGLPVVTTRTGVAPDVIVPGRNGLFVNYGDVSRLSECIMRILSDESFRREAERGRGRILREYSSQREAELYERAYRDLLL